MTTISIMKTPLQKLTVFIGLLAILSSLHAADPVVTNVSAAQRAGTKLVDITFDVSDADSDQLDISVNVSDDAGATFDVPSSALSGDTSINATPAATSRALVWDAGVDFNQQFNSSMVVRVIADDGSAPGPPPHGMKLIPAGEFIMGSSGSGGDENPLHSVYISAFYMDEFEVTKKLWDKVKEYADANGYGFENTGMGQGAHHPVHTINWYDAIKWCNARSEMEGLTPVYHTSAAQTVVYRTGQTEINNDAVKWEANGYRLPTEAEWEKAARGGLAGEDYPWGNSTPNGGDANYSGSSDPFGPGPSPDTSPVGFYDGGQVPAGPDRANGYGLYDVAGNVWEWCWDVYQTDWYEQAGAEDADTRGPNISTGSRVRRGGSWGNCSGNLRCASRAFSNPVVGNFNHGFRSARGL